MTNHRAIGFVNERMLYAGYNCTPLQIEYLRFIIEYARDHNGNSPDTAKLAAHFGVVWNTARGHIMQLSNRRLVRVIDSEIIVERSSWEPPEDIVE